MICRSNSVCFKAQSRFINFQQQLFGPEVLFWFSFCFVFSLTSTKRLYNKYRKHMSDFENSLQKRDQQQQQQQQNNRFDKIVHFVLLLVVVMCIFISFIRLLIIHIAWILCAYAICTSMKLMQFFNRFAFMPAGEPERSTERLLLLLFEQETQMCACFFYSFYFFAWRRLYN